MQYRNFGKMPFQVSALSMGCMRLPRMVDSNNETVVDREKAYEMIRYAVDNGINYFDSAYGYHSRTSEEVLGEALEGGRREKVKIATKQPFRVMEDLKTGGGANIHDNARRNLENTLKKLRTSYIDLYLIHGIGKDNWEGVKANKIIEEYEKYRSEGLIKGIAFSFHGNFECFKEVMEFYPWDMCQVQQNFMDIERECTEEGIKLAGQKNCAMVVMEPLRGGSLATPPDHIKDIYNEYPVKRSGVEWAFRHVINYPEVSSALSGMSTLEQIKENLEIFSKPDMVANCLSPEEKAIIVKAKQGYESVKGVPCTACDYCMPCPMGVQIPRIFGRYNDGKMFGNFEPAKRGYMFLTNQKGDATQCTECGECVKKCPQNIDIPKELKTVHDILGGWKE